MTCRDPALATDRARARARTREDARVREELVAARWAPSSPVSGPASTTVPAGEGPDLPVYFVNTHSRCAKTSGKYQRLYPEI